MIGLTEHSRLYVNSKEVGSFFSFIVIKYLMTGPNGNSEFCFPKTHNIPRGEAEENIEVKGKQNSLFPRDQSLSVLLYLPTQNQKKLGTKRLLYAGWLINLPRFQEADLITSESKVHVFVP